MRKDGEVVPWIDEDLNPFTGEGIARARLKSWERGTWSRCTQPPRAKKSCGAAPSPVPATIHNIDHGRRKMRTTTLTPAPIVFFDIAGPKVEEIASFYASLFGWDLGGSSKRWAAVKQTYNRVPAPLK